MKINTSFVIELNKCLAQMGAALKKLDLSSQKGIKVKLSEVKSKGGLLSYDDHQVVVFIPDHSYKTVPVVKKNPTQGNKYHFAECVTLDEMRASGRYEHRYHANHNPDGLFEIFDNKGNTAQDIPLMPCQNCLKHINYQGFADSNATERHNILTNFSVVDLLSTYSTWFKNTPNIKPKIAGYTQDWQYISLNFRAQKNFTCEECHVNLSNYKHLIHTHHINGNKQDNSLKNLKALCIDCHRKQHYHDHLLITPEQMQIITQARVEQGLLKIESWNKLYQLSDEALHGVLKRYERKQPQIIPRVYYAVTPDITLDIAWVNQKTGIYVDLSIKQQQTLRKAGWSLLTVDESLKN